MTQQFTRVGAILSGFDYQDLIALELLLDMLEHPDLYQWIMLEAPKAGSLDDVIALRTDGKFVARQVKHGTKPSERDSAWSWEELLGQDMGKKGLKKS